MSSLTSPTKIKNAKNVLKPKIRGKIQISKNDVNKWEMRMHAIKVVKHIWISPFLESLQMHICWRSFIFQNATCLDFAYITYQIKQMLLDLIHYTIDIFMNENSINFNHWTRLYRRKTKFQIKSTSYFRLWTRYLLRKTTPSSFP